MSAPPEPDRRKKILPDTGERRRMEDITARREEFRLLRDKILLGIGAFGLGGLTLAAIVFDIKNQTIALAALASFGTLLGVPSFLRLDEKRREETSGQ